MIGNLLYFHIALCNPTYSVRVSNDVFNEVHKILICLFDLNLSNQIKISKLLEETCIQPLSEHREKT